MMKSANDIPYSYLLDLFRKGEPMIDETTFYFMEESPGDSHIIGYLGYGSQPVADKPYWAGYCDHENGFTANTADELFEAPIYGGKSLKDRWKDVYIWTIGPMEPKEFIQMFREKYPIEPFS